MKSVAVSDPRGRRWKVSVRMLPWGLRWRGPGARKGSATEQGPGRPRWYDTLDLPDVLGAFDEGFGGFVAVLLVVVAIVVAILFVLPAFIFLVEVFLVLVLMLGAFLMRVLFRQPWIIDAIAEDGTRQTWKVVGYRAATKAVSEIAAQLARGTETPIARGATLVR